MNSQSPPDVPLQHAIIYWTNEGQVVVLDKRQAPHNMPSKFLSAGACYGWWQCPQTTTKARLLALFVEVMQITTLFRVTAKKVDKALGVIPEYRDLMTIEPVGFWKNTK